MSSKRVAKGSNKQSSKQNKVDVLSPDQRRAQGKALREKVPRSAHAGWNPPKNRRDPIEILVESNQGRLPELIPIRYGRM